VGNDARSIEGRHCLLLQDFGFFSVLFRFLKLKAIHTFEKPETDYPLRAVISQVAPACGSLPHSNHDVSEWNVYTRIAGSGKMLIFPDGVDAVSLAS
jgi:hypothetical protein